MTRAAGSPGPAEVLAVTGTGHVPQLSHPELVAEAIEKFRMRVAAAASRAAKDGANQRTLVSVAQPQRRSGDRATAQA